MTINSKYKLTLILTFLSLGLSAQIISDSIKFEQTLNFNPLNPYIVPSLIGIQSKSNFVIIKDIELLNTATYLFGQTNNYFMNDLRLCLAGSEPQKWCPGIGGEIGYLYMSRDFLKPNEDVNQSGFLFSSYWYLPLRIVSNGYVIAKSAYVIRPNSKDMQIFNCFVHWNLTKYLGFYIGGDIYTQFGGYKYSGFVVGLSNTVWRKNYR
ncbi:hypothetical protein EBU71_23175 [bacterium]|nr:hypothetical protein [Candidatus Elulimicrobium humile]